MKYYIRAAKKFLDLNWEDGIYKNSDLNHKQLADLLEFNYYRPSLRMCKRNFGVTIERFFIHCRVADIKQFLVQPKSKGYELKDVVQKLGYPHQPNFNRQFKLVTGITVQEFRYFHKHFVKTTNMNLVDYEKPDLEFYIPEDHSPTFLSNFLNSQRQKVIEHQTY